MQRTFRIAWLGLIVVAAVGATFVLGLGYKKRPAMTLRTAQVQRRNLEATISATGTVEPEDVVDIGAQVAGLIKEFGKDKNGKNIDWGSPVEQGTVLAHIDDVIYRANVAAAKAQLQQAQANVISANANVLQMQAKLVQATQDWDRAQKLGPSEALAPSAYDQYRANYEVAKANLAVAQAAVAQAQAAVAQAQAAVAQAQAAVDSAEQNLRYCTIISPVGFDHGAGHSFLLLYAAKAPYSQKSKDFKGLVHYLSNILYKFIMNYNMLYHSYNYLIFFIFL